MTDVPRVLLDARKLGDSGIGVYIENLIDGFLELTTVTLTLLVEPNAKRAAQERWGSKIAIIPVRAKKYSLAEYFVLPLYYRALFNAHDLFHSPHYTLPFFLEIPSVVTIHDAIHYTHPETLLHKLTSRVLIASALSRATAVITVSESSAQVLRESFHGERRDISVILNAVRPCFKPTVPGAKPNELAQRGMDHGYMLFVGSGRPHKGLDELIRALVQLRDQQRYEVGKLLVVGDRISDRTRKLVRSLGLSDAVSYYGACDAETLISIYAGASCVVVPSRAEGFGLVALEAMAMGIPVVCSAAPSLVEVCGDCAWYSEDFSVAALAAAIAQVKKNPEETKQKTERGLRRVQEFSMAHAASQTLEVYRRVLDNPGRGALHGDKSEDCYRSTTAMPKRVLGGGGR